MGTHYSRTAGGNYRRLAGFASSTLQAPPDGVDIHLPTALIFACAYKAIRLPRFGGRYLRLDDIPWLFKQIKAAGPIDSPARTAWLESNLEFRPPL